MKNPRYYAKSENGKGYLYDREFSDRIPISVETTYGVAYDCAKRFNEQEEYEDEYDCGEDC